METLKNRRETLFRKFTLKSLQVKQMKNILIENDKLHIMKKRKTEQYKIQSTNTQRFQQSTGIQMQHVINQIL